MMVLHKSGLSVHRCHTDEELKANPATVSEVHIPLPEAGYLQDAYKNTIYKIQETLFNVGLHIQKK